MKFVFDNSNIFIQKGNFKIKLVKTFSGIELL